MKMMLTCAEAGWLIAESQDRNLGFMERFALRFHLTMCKICPTYERQLIALRNIMARWAGVSAEGASASVPTLSPDARARIAQAMRNARVTKG